MAAKVWVFPYQEEVPATSEPTPSVTDADGKATANLGGLTDLREVQFFARDTAGRIGSLVTSRAAEGAVNVRLVEVGDRTGRVIDDNGKPIADAMVTITAAFLERKDTGKKYDYYQINLPDWESQRLAVRTNADGRFTLKEFSGDGRTDEAGFAPMLTDASR